MNLPSFCRLARLATDLSLSSVHHQRTLGHWEEPQHQTPIFFINTSYCEACFKTAWSSGANRQWNVAVIIITTEERAMWEKIIILLCLVTMRQFNLWWAAMRLIVNWVTILKTIFYVLCQTDEKNISGNLNHCPVRADVQTWVSHSGLCKYCSLATATLCLTDIKKHL